MFDDAHSDYGISTILECTVRPSTTELFVRHMVFAYCSHQHNIVNHMSGEGWWLARISAHVTFGWTGNQVIYMDRRVGPSGHSCSHHIIVALKNKCRLNWMIHSQNYCRSVISRKTISCVCSTTLHKI